PAISLKFKYLDTQFFIFFTHNKQITPAYQKEFKNIFTTATNNYKQINNITIINRKTRSTITKMLKTYLIIQYLLSINLTRLNQFHILKIIQYCRGFLQLSKIK